MLTLRPTKQLARKLGIVLPGLPPPVPFRVGDWCVNDFQAEGHVWLMVCHTVSFYPFVMSANNVRDAESLVARVAGGMTSVVAKVGGNSQFTDWTRTFPGSLQWAPIPGRSVLGTMNELTSMAVFALEDGMDDPQQMSQWLAGVPLKALNGNVPRRVFASGPPPGRGLQL